jgi:hypothetical protein
VNLRVLALLPLLLLGCRAMQPVVWKYHAPLDASRGALVEVTARCAVPPEHLALLRQSIQPRVSEVLYGRIDDPSAYRVEVEITRYDRGDKLTRVFSLGLAGRMRLEGTVRVRAVNPPEALAEGRFEKWHGTLLPFANILATMERSVVPKVGSAVARALKQSVRKE